MSVLRMKQEEYAAAVFAMKDAADAIEKAPDDITSDDLDALTATFSRCSDAVDAAKRSVELYEQTAAALALATPVVDVASQVPDVQVKSEPLTYSQHSENSFFCDMWLRDKFSDDAARDRLARHRKEMEVQRAGNPAKYDLSSTDAAGGFLVAPLWLQDEFVNFARAGRVVANTIGSRPLPPKTDSINLPTQATGTAVAAQTDNSSVTETDATFGTVVADVRTIAGLQDVSQQLLDRSYPGIDQIVFADLSKAYNVNLDTAAISSNVANSLGLLNVSGVNAVTYTDASPTVAELYPKISDAVQQIASGIFMPATGIFMHPRRWAFFLSGVDGQNRPLITPYAPQNSVGSFGGVIEEGAVGSVQGLPVYIDPNIPTNLGAGTNEDRIIVARLDELYLWEDGAGPYLRTFEDVGSATMTVRFRLHNYYAQIYARRPKAISIISGTGLAAPTF